ncbi:MAG: hypothetical protein ACT4P7_05915 [Gemmatimonadaceae bacterium]
MSALAIAQSPLDGVRAHRWLLLIVGLYTMPLGCAIHRRPTVSPSTMAELWEEPTDIEQRDLLHGPGGPSASPQAGGRFRFVALKSTGTQPGYDVKDEKGQEWSVKLGVESRVEVAVSRIVWAVGYHQPVVYHLPQWTLVSEDKESTQTGSRFRLEPPTHEKRTEWSWRDNPFLGTRELAGLFVLMVMVNNWDLKTAQNALYEVHESGEDDRTWYVVRDLGASLGKSSWLSFGSKDDPAAFEQEPFIKGVESNRVRFHFDGAWLEPQLHDSVTPEDVRWICRLLARLSARQWSDAFRAGGFSEAEADRYIHRMQEKIAEGMKVGFR